MHKLKSLYLLIAVLMTAGCATSKAPLMPPTRQQAQLDSKLAEPCAVIPYPDSQDFDVWQLWAQQLLTAYGECAGRHAETVKAWPK